jgi:arginine decarboxylase
MTDWTIDDARRTYNIAHWSSGYVDVNDKGNLSIHPAKSVGPGVDLYELARQAAEQLTFPILLRFNNILHDRVDTLYSAFSNAISQDDYQGSYTAVYPIKVNQQRSVVEQILSHGKGRVGLEAGSKPELMAVMALSEPGGVIVCNGYKDREYIRLALIGRSLGQRIYIVIEKPSELDLVIQESNKLGIEPLLGMRVRLASIGAGKWQITGGEKSKFGLNAAQLLGGVEKLQDAGLPHCLQMLHFHLGSQLPNIRDIQRGMRECARYYAELRSLGININCIDVGGGLGIDYEGTRSRSYCSMNYSVDEYAHNVVHALWEICEEQDLPHPDIFSESGRALTAHHAVLVTNIIDTGAAPDNEDASSPDDDDPIILHDMWRHYTALSTEQQNSSLAEIYHDIHHVLSEAQAMYTHGVLNLAQRAYVEELYFAMCYRIREKLNPAMKQYRDILDELNEKLADKYFTNFSLFQSLPDVWAIKQIFPVLPLHRLNERPTRRGVIEDITCDSDGRIDSYVDNEGIESSLPLHTFNRDEKYLLGMFLVGAYQEILGDMHNLFGDTDAIDVTINNDGSYELSNSMHGDTVDSVLRYVHFDHNELLKKYQQKLQASELNEDQRKMFIEELEAGLTGYTYLED